MIEYIVHPLLWTVGIGVGLFLLAVCMAGLYLIACIIHGLVKGLITGFKPPSENKKDV